MYKRSAMQLVLVLMLAAALGVLIKVTLTEVTFTEAAPQILYVVPAGVSCGVSPCYHSVQAAVNAAVPHAEIRVAEGIYADLHVYPRHDITTTGVMSVVVYLDKTLTLRGGYPPGNWAVANPTAHPAILDAQERGRALFITGYITPTIEGFQLTNGRENQYPGGAVFVQTATVTLRNNYIHRNYGKMGGGVYLQQSAARVENNTFDNNHSAYGGGALYLHASPALVTHNTISNGTSCCGTGVYADNSGAVIASNTIFSNTAWDAGGGILLNQDSSTVQYNTIDSNEASSNGLGGGMAIFEGTPRVIANYIANNISRKLTSVNFSGGGGLYIHGVPTMTLAYNTIYANSAADCGGMAVVDSNLHSRRNTISSNQARYTGGACLFRAFFVSDADSIIHNTAEDGTAALLLHLSTLGIFTNTLIADNHTLVDPYEGIVFINGVVTMTHATIANNTGQEAIHIRTWSGGTPSHLTLKNSLIVSHTAGIQVIGPASLELDSILWHATPVTLTQSGEVTLIVTNTYSGAPGFVAPAVGNYHLRADSAAIDRGILTGVIKDFEGEPRPNGLPDLGYDEYWEPGSPGALKRIYLPFVFR